MALWRFLIVPLALMALAGCWPFPTGQAVRLSAGVNSPHPVRDATIIIVKLENVGAAPVSLSARTDGPLAVVSLTRDGKPVRSRTRIAHYSAAPAWLLARSVVPVAPGAALTSTWTSVKDRLFGGWALTAVSLDAKGEAKITYYDLSSAGRYRISLAYRYPAAKPALAWRSKTNQVDLDLIVTP